MRYEDLHNTILTGFDRGLFADPNYASARTQ